MKELEKGPMRPCLKVIGELCYPKKTDSIRILEKGLKYFREY